MHDAVQILEIAG